MICIRQIICLHLGSVNHTLRSLRWATLIDEVTLPSTTIVYSPPLASMLLECFWMGTDGCFLATFVKNLWTDFHQIYRASGTWYRKQMLKFWGWITVWVQVFSLSVQEHRPTIIPYCKNNSMRLKFSVQLLRCSLNTLVKSGKMPKKCPRRLPSLLVCWCCYLAILLITQLVKIDYYYNHKWIL